MTRSHVIAWRDDLVGRALSGMTVRHRLAALSSLFEHLCESNAVTHNPVKGVKRPPVESYEGKTPALGDHQARALLEAPNGVSLKGKRDRAILATLLYHALRREELCKLKVEDYGQERRGVPHLKISGKGGKTRYVPLHPAAAGAVLDWFANIDNKSTRRAYENALQDFMRFTGIKQPGEFRIATWRRLATAKRSQAPSSARAGQVPPMR